MDYNFSDIEKKWQAYWVNNQTYKVTEDASKPKYYVLDMFPYPSGAGLHVGHPLGYIASDIYSRYKRLKGFNVLHPMGYDAFGLPAEQYAIQTGHHPALTTDKNIQRYREQLDKLGFSYDWDREFRTCDPSYYHWTQWVFIQMFNHYYCYDAQQARPIAELVSVFEQQGTTGLNIACTEPLSFTAEEWRAKSEKEQQETLLNYRIAYKGNTMVNWCPALGTVLANDEVSEGLSVRGGHPVEQKMMSQWCLRVSAYAQRLLEGLDTIDWTDALKETQRNWIGRSEGAEMTFRLVSPHKNLSPSPSPQERGNACQDRSRFYTTDIERWKKLEETAKQLRFNQTEAEQLLWEELRAKKTGYKIRKQHIINTFIVDFVSLDKGIAIEIDGGIHNTPEQKEYDEVRTQILAECGFEVIRFSNKDILDNPSTIAQKIKTYLDSKPSKQWTDKSETLPLSCGEGLGERSSCCEERFSCEGNTGELHVFTTRPDTIYGVTFMVLAPESEYVVQLVTPEQKAEVAAYLDAVKRRTERERIADRRVTGVFSGSYAINPVSGTEIPIWISDYVLAGYGTGAIMAVPAHDSRDYAFAKHFNLPIIPLIEGCDVSEESFDAKEGIMINSGFLNGLTVKEAIAEIKEYITEEELGQVKVNYRLRDAIFSRQRYWGEPFPVYYKDDVPYMMDEKDLPLQLPEVDKFLPTETGEPPLGRAKSWTYKGYPLELSTMPGFAGSSAYYLRYMDPHNSKELVSKQADEYWQDVDLYIGGTEHATGHLVYSRFWNKFLFDLDLVCKDEPFKKLVNQGMIQGRSNFVYRLIFRDGIYSKRNIFISSKYAEGLRKDGHSYIPILKKEMSDQLNIDIESSSHIQINTQDIHVDVNIVENDILNIDNFKAWMPEYATAEFILEDGKYVCGWAVEKMSKSMFNVVNPDTIVEKYGADTLRMYEMFLGPLEQSKPWDTKGIDGVHRFLRKLWRLFHDDKNILNISDEKATDKELKALHKTIKKVQQDIEGFSFNTSVSAFMICVNELGDLKCNKREVLEPLTILLSPFAPHICEELWEALGHTESVTQARYPEYNEGYLTEDAFDYPVSFNGKVRFKKNLPLSLSAAEVEQAVLADENTSRWLEGKAPKKIIVVLGKIVNIVM